MNEEMKKIEKKKKTFFVITENKEQERKLRKIFYEPYLKEFNHEEIVKEILKDKDLYAYIRQFVTDEPRKIELCEGCEYEAVETIAELAKAIAEAISGYGKVKHYIGEKEMKDFCKKVDKVRGK